MSQSRSFQPATQWLFFLFCVLATLYGLTFLYRPTRTATFSSSLILPQDFQDIEEMSFSIPITAEPVEMGKMTFTKSGNRFILRTANGSYQVRQDILERFFLLLSTKQTFMSISKKPRDYPLFALEDKQAAQISLRRKDRTLIADLFFGATDATASGRYIRTGRSVNVFLIDNSIAPFLTVSPSFWLDLQIYRSLFHSTDIQGFEYKHRQTFRDEKNDTLFRSLEVFLEKFSAIDVYSAPALQSQHTEHVRLVLGDESELIFSYSPLQNGDYVFFDSRSSNAYLMSGYTCAQLVRHIENITGDMSK